MEIRAAHRSYVLTSMLDNNYVKLRVPRSRQLRLLRSKQTPQHRVSPKFAGVRQQLFELKGFLRVWHSHGVAVNIWDVGTHES